MNRFQILGSRSGQHRSTVKHVHSSSSLPVLRVRTDATATRSCIEGRFSAQVERRPRQGTHNSFAIDESGFLNRGLSRKCRSHARLHTARPWPHIFQRNNSTSSVVQDEDDPRLLTPSLPKLSRFWIPTEKLADTKVDLTVSAQLTRAGFLRQTHAGIFQLLPLAFRIQQKIERLLDHHMECLGASRLSLSTFSSVSLWERSGRLKNDDAGELFRTEDRRGAQFLLSPTHEEEITDLVSGLIPSYRSLPVRLYQITRKYRDELRPRGGLLRTREFLMKDLYTFDVDKASALSTYDEVRAAYRAFFSELKIPYHEAKALSGSIGGDMSHEYHIVSSMGEDDLAMCAKCSFSSNVEALPERTVPETCPGCGSSSLRTEKSIELGHAFYLGTKYSSPLRATVDNQQGERVSLEMGCFGIGITRMMAAIAGILQDDRGFNWPHAIAPFHAVVIPASEKMAETAQKLSHRLRNTQISPVRFCDSVQDDRDLSLAWKLRDAELIGYPVAVIVGRRWEKDGLLEVKFRKEGVTKFVGEESLPDVVRHFLQSQ